MVMVPDAGTRGHSPTAPTPPTPPTPASQAPQPVTQPDTDLTNRLAMALGIMAGDDYGTAPDAPPPDEIAHVFGVQSGTDPTDEAARRDANANPQKATTAPANGGTIYSGSFAHDLLASLNLPVTFENVRFINAWMRAETGNQGPGTPAFNPLATTQNYGSNTKFNSVGVKNYSDYHTGVMATANVLVNGKYQPILDALARGNDAMSAARAVAQTPWGTGHGVEKILGG